METKQIRYFYPLYRDSNREYFDLLNNAVDKKFTFIGNNADRESFIKALLCLQMIKDFRAPLSAIKANLNQKTDLKEINAIIEKTNFDLDYSWVTWGHEKLMVKRAQKLSTSALEIVGNQEEFDEFVLRYLISIWLADWEGPLYALLVSTEGGTANLTEMNELLSYWDFTGIFL